MNMERKILVFVFYCCFCSSGNSEPVINSVAIDLANLLSGLGWKNLDLVFTSHAKEEQIFLLKSLYQNEFLLQIGPVWQVQGTNFGLYYTVVWIKNCDIGQEWTNILIQTMGSRNPYTVLFFNQGSPCEIETFSKPFQSHSLGFLFHEHGIEHNNTVKIQTFSNHPKIAIAHQMVKISPTSEVLRTIWNYHGTALKAVTLPWAPFVILRNCDTLGRNCQSNGIVMDIFNTLANRFNFTIDLIKEPSGKWAIEPVQGSWQDPNPVFEGILGRLGSVDIALSVWRTSSEKRKHFDFSSVMFREQSRIWMSAKQMKSCLNMTLMLAIFE